MSIFGESSIEILFNFGIGGSLQGTFYEFTGLDATTPEVDLTGFSLNVSSDLASVFEADRISFGPDSVRVNLFKPGFGSNQDSAGSRITANLQLTPRAIPEPASIAMLGTGILGLLGYGRRRGQSAAPLSYGAGGTFP